MAWDIVEVALPFCDFERACRYELASRLSVDVRTISRMVRRGELPPPCLGQCGLAKVVVELRDRVLPTTACKTGAARTAGEVKADIAASVRPQTERATPVPTSGRRCRFRGTSPRSLGCCGVMPTGQSQPTELITTNCAITHSVTDKPCGLGERSRTFSDAAPVLAVGAGHVISPQLRSRSAVA